MSIRKGIRKGVGKGMARVRQGCFKGYAVFLDDRYSINYLPMLF